MPEPEEMSSLSGHGNPISNGFATGRGLTGAELQYVLSANGEGGRGEAHLLAAILRAQRERNEASETGENPFAFDGVEYTK